MRAWRNQSGNSRSPPSRPRSSAVRRRGKNYGASRPAPVRKSIFINAPQPCLRRVYQRHRQLVAENSSYRHKPLTVRSSNRSRVAAGTSAGLTGPNARMARLSFVSTCRPHRAHLERNAEFQFDLATPRPRSRSSSGPKAPVPASTSIPQSRASPGSATVPRCCARNSMHPAAGAACSRDSLRQETARYPERRRPMTAITVYGFSGSPFLRSVEVALKEKDVPYHLQTLAPGPTSSRSTSRAIRSAAFRPSSMTGFTLYETQAIIRYIDEMFPTLPRRRATQGSARDEPNHRHHRMVFLSQGRVAMPSTGSSVRSCLGCRPTKVARYTPTNQ